VARGDAFEGRTALVTGATRGIGLAIAQILVERGARVCVTARKQEGLDGAVERLGAGRALGVQGRADDPDHQAAAVAATMERFGSLDVLVNNAGVNPQFGPLVEADLGAVRKIMDVNVVAALAWVQHAWKAWMAEHGGVVLNVSSLGGLRAEPGIGAYNASKAALLQLTRQLALELAPGVRVNAIAPAVVKTQFARRLWEGRDAEAAVGYPLGRFGDPADTATLAAFLLSDEASWITGETVVLDGGISARGFSA
jgi:NAD(P)-dependent dehydrogenase (short-subunit alcohol dehydrogenase family)